MKEFKILITGSNGLLGQKLTDILIRRNQDNQATKITLLATSRGQNRNPKTDGYTYLDLDVTNPDMARQIIAKHVPDVIIHTAAMTNVDSCETNPQACYALNVDAVASLAALAEEYKIHLIHLSTDFIFDGEKGPYKEEDTANPLSVYGKSKLLSEQAVQAMQGPWTILRTILVYGVIADPSHSNIVLWAKASFEQQKHLRVINDQSRMPTLVEDLAEACIACALGHHQGIYHISGPDLLTIDQIIAEVADFWKFDHALIETIDTKTLNQAATRPPRTGFHLDKAFKTWGYSPHTFREGLAIIERQLQK